MWPIWWNFRWYRLTNYLTMWKVNLKKRKFCWRRCWSRQKTKTFWVFDEFIKLDEFWRNVTKRRREARYERWKASLCVYIHSLCICSLCTCIEYVFNLTCFASTCDIKFVERLVWQQTEHVTGQRSKNINCDVIWTWVRSFCSLSSNKP